MKPILSFIAFLLFVTSSSAQISPQTPWTWMKGDNTVDHFGVYGTQGVADTVNHPGARNISSTWSDQSGNLWLFGGMGFGTTQSGFLNDLWKYDPSTNKWVWMKGDNNPNYYSNYGVQGVAGSANKPGGTYSGISWIDNTGNLWLFGGFGYSGSSFGFLNTLWKYNITSNEWTWIKGDSTIDQVGIYGTQGIANSANKPGARYGSQTWTDASGNLWLFGGYGYDESNSGILNDIWKYNPVTNNWTWIKGDNLVEQVGVYGIKGIPNAANKPGARYVSSSWIDKSGNLWLFGGYGYDENKSGNLNDLWEYNLLTNEWMWVNGDSVIDQPGIYGTQGLANVNNKPGARYVSSSWIDDFGELWMFGGYGYDASNIGYMNDLWKYSPVSNKWTWIKGDTTVDKPGIYGTQGMPDSTNKSGARNGSVSWADAEGNLWLFGGYGFDGNTTGALNDLWKIKASGPIVSVNLLQFTGALYNEAAHLNWKTEQEKNFSHFKIERSFDEINFSAIGTVTGSGNNSMNYYIYTDDLSGQLQQKVFYRLQMMDKNGHFTYSKVLRFDLAQKAIKLTVFPNPAINTLNLSFAQAQQGTVLINITDIRGITVKQQTETMQAGRISMNVDVSILPLGTYILSVNSEEFIISHHKFIKQE